MPTHDLSVCGIGELYWFLCPGCAARGEAETLRWYDEERKKAATAPSEVVSVPVVADDPLPF